MTAFFFGMQGLVREREVLTSLHLTGTQTARAHIHPLPGAADEDGHALDIGMPGFVGASVGMADVVTEMNALAANFTFRHDRTSL
jgi:hypothetical protein